MLMDNLNSDNSQDVLIQLYNLTSIEKIGDEDFWYWWTTHLTFISALRNQLAACISIPPYNNRTNALNGLAIQLINLIDSLQPLYDKINSNKGWFIKLRIQGIQKKVINYLCNLRII